MLISEIIPIRKNNPPTTRQINDAADKELLGSFPFAIKFIIKIPKIIIMITVPSNPPSPPHPEGIQNI